MCVIVSYNKPNKTKAASIGTNMSDKDALFGEFLRLWAFNTVVMFLAHTYLYKKKDNDPNQLLKRVPGWPLLGNIELIRDIKRFADVLKSYAEIYGKYVEIYLLGTRILLISDPVLVKEVLMKRPYRFRRAENLSRSVAGFDSVVTSLFFAEGEMWKRQRRLTSPSFSHRNVGNMGYVINQKLDELVARIQVGI